jgi:hypothetical protein
LNTVGIAPTPLVTTKIFANEASIHTSKWWACLLIKSFTGAPSKVHSGLKTKVYALCAYFYKKKKDKEPDRKAYENPGH